MGLLMHRVTKRHIGSLTCLAVAGVLSACGGDPVDKGAAQPTPTGLKSTSAAIPVSTRIVWTYFGTFADEPQAIFVVRVTNSEDRPSNGVALEIHALDRSGTIVGSNQVAMPTVPPRAHFEYLGRLGGTAFSELTGKPAMVQVALVSGADLQPPLLSTSQLQLRKGQRADSLTDAPYAYDLTVKVTNDTGQPLSTPVHQQAILYDSAGNIVGGDEGSSDNQPATLPADASYREEWTGIPATRSAVMARYSVWPEQ